jgi:glutamine synthetase
MEGDLVERARLQGTRIVRFLFCDYSAIVHAKAVGSGSLRRKLTEGVGSTRAQMALNVRDELIDIPQMPPVGEVRLVPDPETYAELPWAPGSASVMCDLITADREPWFACPRSFLKRQAAAAEERGLTIDASFELEFYLGGRAADGGVEPLPRHPVYSTIGLDEQHDVVLAIVETLGELGIPAEGILNEYGAGQFEISVPRMPAVQAADRQVKVRDAIRGVAVAHGMRASFAPKPFLDQIGSGAHLHISVWKDGRNLLHDPAAEGALSAEGRHVVAGLLEHMAGLMGLVAPTVNSYQRLIPDTWAGVFNAWGFDNRETPVRVASPFWGREEQSLNIELKTVDSSANPYLALGGVIAATLAGLEAAGDPGEPVAVNPARLDDPPARLPLSLEEVLAALEADAVLAGAMGDDMLDTYLRLKRSEVAAYEGMEPDAIAAEYRYKF